MSETIGQKHIEWVAGLFEGEGCLTYICDDRWILKVQMTDSDVMTDLYIALGCRGNLNKLRKSPSALAHHKPTQTWQTSKRDLINEICKELYPYMGNRRKEKFDEFFDWYAAKTQ